MINYYHKGRFSRLIEDTSPLNIIGSLTVVRGADGTSTAILDDRGNPVDSRNLPIGYYKVNIVTDNNNSNSKGKDNNQDQNQQNNQNQGNNGGDSQDKQDQNQQGNQNQGNNGGDSQNNQDQNGQQNNDPYQQANNGQPDNSQPDFSKMPDHKNPLDNNTAQSHNSQMDSGSQSAGQRSGSNPYDKTNVSPKDLNKDKLDQLFNDIMNNKKAKPKSWKSLLKKFLENALGQVNAKSSEGFSPSRRIRGQIIRGKMDTKPIINHLVLAFDRSGSMSADKWKDVLSSLAIFFKDIVVLHYHYVYWADIFQVYKPKSSNKTSNSNNDTNSIIKNATEGYASTSEGGTDIIKAFEGLAPEIFTPGKAKAEIKKIRSLFTESVGIEDIDAILVFTDGAFDFAPISRPNKQANINKLKKFARQYSYKVGYVLTPDGITDCIKVYDPTAIKQQRIIQLVKTT